MCDYTDEWEAYLYDLISNKVTLTYIITKLISGKSKSNLVNW